MQFTRTSLGSYVALMEPLRVRVRSVEVLHTASLAVGRVTAFSKHTVHGKQAARIDITVTFNAQRGARCGSLWRQARDEAIKYLDIQ